MPLNRNPAVVELLSWHGQDRGGVRVPFQGAKSPFGSTIGTGLVLKLRGLAKSIATSTPDTPRFIFLVGGPGNGKSETVEDFLRTLDTELGLKGELASVLATRFAPTPLVQRRVEVAADDLSGSAEFKERVGRLVVIQDATASDEPGGDAARALADDVADLLTSNEVPLPLFVVCANRGLLARAVKEASREFGPDQPVTKLLITTIKATSLGTEALAGARIPCWPIPSFETVACWPLDLESLIGNDYEVASPPLKQVLNTATETSSWDVSGRCSDCDAAPNCPFRLNSATLRQAAESVALLKILRRGELATGQRWNFRDAFSLTAELIVGQWSDFEGFDHPCAWVHETVSLLSAEPVEKTRAVRALVAKSYVHSLFPNIWIAPAVDQLRREANLDGKPVTKTLLEVFSDQKLSSTKHVRQVLSLQYAALDPAVYTPAQPEHALRVIEDSYNQSVSVGNEQSVFAELNPSEQVLLAQLAIAEQEWDILGRAPSQAIAILNTLRRLGSTLVKRSIGVRHGQHAQEDYLRDFSQTLRDQERLDALKSELQALLGQRDFRFDAVESFGQPQEERGGTFVLTGPAPGIKPHPAPVTTASMTGHDVASFEFTSTKDHIPITFEFYLALRLRAERCANSSLPASVRAAIDRIRHRYAGVMCRDLDRFADGTVMLSISAERKIVRSPDGVTKLANIPPAQGAR